MAVRLVAPRASATLEAALCPQPWRTSLVSRASHLDSTRAPMACWPCPLLSLVGLRWRSPGGRICRGASWLQPCTTADVAVEPPPLLNGVRQKVRPPAGTSSLHASISVHGGHSRLLPRFRARRRGSVLGSTRQGRQRASRLCGSAPEYQPKVAREVTCPTRESPARNIVQVSVSYCRITRKV